MPDAARRFLCRLIGHRWQAAYREPDGYPICRCSRSLPIPADRV